MTDLPLVRLGNTGLRVSRLSLGTMTFGGQCDAQAVDRILGKAVDAGINLLDTANVYPFGKDIARNGTSERMVGEWIAAQPGRRQSVLLATKAGGVMGPGPCDRGASRKHLLDSVDASLQRLRTDYVDLFQVHHDDPDTGLEETLLALDTIVRSGRARYVGVSNFLAYRAALALGIGRAQGFMPLVSVQCRYSLLFRELERELFPLARETGLGVLAYNPLAGGLLTGRYQPGQEADGGRFGSGDASVAYRQRYWNDPCITTAQKLGGIAAEEGVPLATLAISWVLANPAVTSCILGASQVAQLGDTVAGATYVLSGSLKTRLDEMTHEFRFGDAPR